MSSILTYDRMQFVEGLLGCLEVRNWTYEKIGNTPAGSDLVDLRMHHYLYFANLFGAVDVVQDQIISKSEKKAFLNAIQGNFPAPGEYIYARELRNSIVHRGLNPITLSVHLDAKVFALCPVFVHSLGNRASYICSVRLVIQLAEACNGATNRAILAFLDEKQMLDKVEEAPVLDARSGPFLVPNCAASTEGTTLALDFDAIERNAAHTCIMRLKILLGRT